MTPDKFTSQIFGTKYWLQSTELYPLFELQVTPMTLNWPSTFLLRVMNTHTKYDFNWSFPYQVIMVIPDCLTSDYPMTSKLPQHFVLIMSFPNIQVEDYLHKTNYECWWNHVVLYLTENQCHDWNKKGSYHQHRKLYGKYR